MQNDLSTQREIVDALNRVLELRIARRKAAAARPFSALNVTLLALAERLEEQAREEVAVARRTLIRMMAVRRAS